MPFSPLPLPCHPSCSPLTPTPPPNPPHTHIHRVLRQKSGSALTVPCYVRPSLSVHHPLLCTPQAHPSPSLAMYAPGSSFTIPCYVRPPPPPLPPYTRPSGKVRLISHHPSLNAPQPTHLLPFPSFSPLLNRVLEQSPAQPSPLAPWVAVCPKQWHR